MSRKTRSSKNPSSVSRDNNHLSVSQQSFSGPIPPPSLLEGYESILPGAAERILALAESEAQHRRDIERQVTRANIRLAKGEHYQVYLGQVLAFLLALVFIGGGVFLIHGGKSIVGSFFSAAALIAIVAAFLKKGGKP
jgi:uncharacterized membrane protein